MSKQKQTEDEPAGVGLRKLALTSSAHSLHFSPDNEFPKVYGIIIDWDVGGTIASILSMRDGSASLYTTASFGIIGGSEHEKVRIAAKNIVKQANTFYDYGNETKEYPYPKSDQVFFYLLTYDGVRKIIGNMKKLEKGNDPTFNLFDAAQDVLTELRITVESKENN